MTLGTILHLTIVLVTLFYVTAWLKRGIVERLLPHSHVDLGVRHAIGSLVRYAVLSLGFIFILQTAGIDVSTVTVLLGALGIGVGFGLQSITNDFVSGSILLFKRPIKVGDRIGVRNVHGDLVNISPPRS